MIHKILPHGARGNPFAYLLHPGREIEAKVRCPQKYTSGLLAFSGILTPERQREIIDSYEQMACAGYRKERARGWIMHRENGRTGVNVS